MTNVLLNYHNTAVNRGKEANLFCTKYTAILQYAKSSLLIRAFTLDYEAHAILIRYGITNLPDRIGIPLEQVLANLWDHCDTLDEAAKSTWEKVFETAR